MTNTDQPAESVPSAPEHLRGAFTEDDVAGHAHRGPESHRVADEEDDVDGHSHRGRESHRVADVSSDEPSVIRGNFADDEDDVEGHAHREPQDVRRPVASPRPQGEADRAPGHIRGF